MCIASVDDHQKYQRHNRDDHHFRPRKPYQQHYQRTFIINLMLHFVAASPHACGGGKLGFVPSSAPRYGLYTRLSLLSLYLPLSLLPPPPPPPPPPQPRALSFPLTSPSLFSLQYLPRRGAKPVLASDKIKAERTCMLHSRFATQYEGDISRAWACILSLPHLVPDHQIAWIWWIAHLPSHLLCCMCVTSHKNDLKRTFLQHGGTFSSSFRLERWYQRILSAATPHLRKSVCLAEPMFDAVPWDACYLFQSFRPTRIGPKTK